MVAEEEVFERIARLVESSPEGADLWFEKSPKVLTLALLLIGPSIQSWHIFRRNRLKRVYRILREYKLHKLRLMILARLLYGEKIELVIDGTIVDIANVNRARTQKIRRVRGKVWWAKRRRKIVRRDYGKVVEFEEV